MRGSPGTRLRRPAIELPRAAVADFCRRHRVRELALFGSVLRSDFDAASDVDVLIELDPEARLGFGFVRLEDELAAIIGRRVDLRTRGDLSRHFREQVLQDRHVVYSAP